MKINHTNIHAKNIILHENALDGQKFKLEPEYFKTITKLEEGKYRLELSIEIKNKPEKPFPLDIIVDFETTYTFNEFKDDEELEHFLNVNAIQMIFPFMRAAINSVVSAAMLPPMVLPIIDVRQFKNR